MHGFMNFKFTLIVISLYFVPATLYSKFYKGMSRVLSYSHEELAANIMPDI